MVLNARKWLQVAFLVAYVAARVVILRGGKVFTSWDTFSYAYRDDPFFNRGPLVSFVGHAPRLWGAPLFYAAFPGDASRAVAQWTLGTVAWALLAWSVAQLMRTTTARVLAFGLILLVGLLREVASWDFAILSESLSLSLGALALAFFLWWRRTESLFPLIGMNVAVFWWIFIRPDIRVLVVALLVPVIVLIWRGASPAARRGALASAIVVAVAFLWCTAINGNTTKEYARYSANAIDQDQELFVYRVRLHVLTDPAIKRTFTDKLGMPECPAADEVAKRTSWDGEDFFKAYSSCPDLVAWGDKNASTMWWQFAKAEPGQFTALMAKLTNDSFTGAAYAQTPSVLPGRAQQAAFPSQRYALLYALGIFVVAAALCLAAGGLRRRRLLTATGLVMGAVSLAGGVAGALLGAGEYWRFGIRDAIAIRCAAVILFVTAVDLFLARRARSRRPDVDSAEAESAPASLSNA